MKWIRFLILGLAACASPAGSKSQSEAPHEAESSPRAIEAKMELEVVPLKFAAAEEVARELRDVLKPRASGQQVRVVADSRSNSIILNGPREDLARVMALIAKLDVKQP